jgi:hypothetical protein
MSPPACTEACDETVASASTTTQSVRAKAISFMLLLSVLFVCVVFFCYFSDFFLFVSTFCVGSATSKSKPKKEHHQHG